jgi:arylsulfatase A
MSILARRVSRRQFLGAAAGVTVAGGCAPLEHLVNSRNNRPKDAPPNFVIIFADDLGYGDLSCYGAELISTPRIDQMAEEGVRFSDFYSLAPICTPSRASLLTGCYPMRVGLPNVLDPWSDIGIHPDEIALAELLKPRGYATACIGKWHLGHQAEFHPQRHGFDYYFGLPYSNDMHMTPKGNEGVPLMRGEEVIEKPADQSTLTKRYTEESIRFIRENKDRPFFLYLPHTFPHIPLFASESFQGTSDAGPYGDAVEEIDWSTGQILDALDECGLDRDTLVIFTSDNGPENRAVRESSAGPLRDGKFSTFEGGMRVPFIARWPKRIKPGTECREIAAMFDLYPTLAGLADANLPTGRIIDGKDIWPLLAGERDARTPHEMLFYYRASQLQAVRSGKWKLIVDYADKKYTSADRKEFELRKHEPHLYDLSTDIGETKDIANENPDVVERLMALAEKCREDLGDAMPDRKGKNVREPGKAVAEP